MKKLFVNLLSLILSLVAFAPMYLANAHANHAHTEAITSSTEAITSSFDSNGYVNERNNRAEMNAIMQEADTPLNLQSRIMTFIGEKYILGEHIPTAIKYISALTIIGLGAIILIFFK